MRKLLAFGALILMGLTGGETAQTPVQERGQQSGQTMADRLPSDTGTNQGREFFLATGTELIQDGGFEVGPAPSGSSDFTPVSGAWTWQSYPLFSTPRAHSSTPGSSHSGDWYLAFPLLSSSSGRIYQTITIPSGATATLSFWLRIFTLETTTTHPYDTLRVAILDTADTLLRTVHTYSNLDAGAATYSQKNFDISEYAGRTVRVEFLSSTDGSFATGFYLDDVSLTSGTSNPNCTEDSYTMCLVGGRYRVTSHWQNQYAGGAVANLKKAKLTDATGAFWINDSATYEYLIRIQIGTGDGHAWIAIPTFTDVEFWVLVEDRVNSQSKTYHSSPGNRTLIYDPGFFVYP